MAKMILKAFKMPESHIRRLQRLAEAGDITEAETLRGLIPGDDLCGVLIDEAALEQVTPADVLRDLIAEALRHRMLTSDPKLDPYFIEPLTTDAIIGEYAKYQDATGPAFDWYLAPAPRGGELERKGITGNVLLHKSERVTKDGIERAV